MELFEEELREPTKEELEFIRNCEILEAAGISRQTIDLMVADQKKQAEIKERKRIVSKLEPYYLTVNVHCNLCGTTHQELFHMEKVEGGLYSRRIEYIPPEITEFKISQQEVRHCVCCQSVLEQMPSEWLAEMLINRAEVRF